MSPMIPMTPIKGWMLVGCFIDLVCWSVKRRQRDKPLPPLRAFDSANRAPEMFRHAEPGRGSASALRRHKEQSLDPLARGRVLHRLAVTVRQVHFHAGRVLRAPP